MNSLPLPPLIVFGYTLVKRTSKKQTGTEPVIVFMVDELASDPWMALAFDGAQKKAVEFGYNAILAVTNDDTEAETALLHQYRDLNLAGVIYGTILTRLVEPAQAVMTGRSVLLNCYDTGRTLHSVLPGDRLGGRTATQHLIDAGHARIGFINGQQGIDASRDRLKGYRQALSSNDIPFDPALVKQGNWELGRLSDDEGPSGPAAAACCHFLRQRSDGLWLLRCAARSGLKRAGRYRDDRIRRLRDRQEHAPAAIDARPAEF